ncbi:hypothetical protein [Variovorax sp. S12S4]|uniref:hypothetical protein n=1 Tax=Variovorax sp. S12S4 TaxID=3029170 RepID=UPI00215C5AE3|nr:hypothetical protein [Variovorax sp. S12S4]
MFDKAGLSDAAHYPYELGWIFVEERFRRMGMAGALTTCLVHGLEEWPVYASSRTNNKGMHKALVNAGFRQVGQHYPGRRTGEEFQVFLKPAG